MKRISLRNLGLLAAGVLCFTVSLLLEKVSFYSVTRHGTVRRFEQTLQEKELYMYGLFDQIEATADSGFTGNLFASLDSRFRPLVEGRGIDLFLYKGDTLKFWTSNFVQTDLLTAGTGAENEVVLMGSGWYVKKERITGDWRITGLILIKKEYPYQNRFLQNTFQDDFHVPAGTEMDTTFSETGQVIHDSWKKKLFSLDFSRIAKYSPLQSDGSLVLYFLGILLFLLYIRNLIRGIKDPAWKNAGILMAALVLLVLNAILFNMHIPDQISNLEIFLPERYAASYLFPTLADLSITSFFIFFLAYLFYTEFSMPAKTGGTTRHIFQVIFFTGLILYFQLIVSVFRSLVVNSSISFETYRVLDISAYTFIGLLILAFHFTALTLLMDKYFSIFRPAFTRMNLALHVFFMGSGVWLSGYMIGGGPDFILTVDIMLVTGVIAVIRGKQFIPYRHSGIILLLFLYSIMSVYQIVVYSAEKKQNEKMVLAVELSAEHDPVAELLLSDLEERIANDRELEYLIVDGYIDELAVDDYLISTYFNGFWEKYDLQFTLCMPTDSLYIEPHIDVWYPCHEFFDSLQNANGTRLPGSRFYYMDNKNGRISYMASFDYFSADSTQTATLFLELDSRLITEALGYPELLLSDRMRKNFVSGEYPYAKYSNGELIIQSGDYSYNLRSDEYSSGNEEFEFTSSNGYRHLAYNMDPNNTIVVSSPEVSLLNILITFTYIFVFFYLLVTLILLIINIPLLKKSFQLNIKNKIQYTMIGVLVLSLLLIGGGTIFFSIRQYSARQNSDLSEKIQSVYIEARHMLEFERTLTREWQAVGYLNLDELLMKFSNVFYTDINLYDPEGNILATSRSEIFENNLLGPKMHPAAYRELAVNHVAEYVHEEQIGSLKYQSAYVPFRNSDNKLLAYLNLPYFTRQEALTMEISNLVVAVANFYVLLIAISVLIAVFISRQITQPLRMIQSKFGKIRLGGTNEKIQYEGRDEIGNLVEEYNHMVDELALSAEKLARSERESAWREMAKQIAHEIKNPLTPMKLSVQHLQRSFSEDPEKQEKNLQRFTRTLIEQIDNLSAIATEFSNFAQMPRANNEEVDLEEKINKICELFLNTEQIKIETGFRHARPAIVYADREHLSRVFINLIKNAIQSIPDNREGKIGVSLETTGSEAIIRIMDNGKGIPDELGDKLFQPNFTTKSSGMGMGLAIVKNIIENAGGSIRYETELGKGTTFIVQFPLYRSEITNE